LTDIRFTYGLGMPDPAHYLPVARAAEESGWDSISVPDSIFYPRDSSATYPYSDDGGREFLENKPFTDPFVLITHMAAATQRIEFLIAVLKLPVRHPVLVAKQAASVAVLTDNRLRLGVGTSPWPEDYEVCGVPWEGRGKRLEEAITVVRGLVGGGYHEHHGPAYDFPKIKLEPVPSRPIPISLGGHAPALLRRAARLADGWIAASNTPAELTERIATLKRLRTDAGRTDVPFRIHARMPEAEAVDGVRRLADLGVTDIVMRFENFYTVEPDRTPLQLRLDALRRYADEVIAKVR
jgi:probable F420-dependent oxidoreductase